MSSATSEGDSRRHLSSGWRRGRGPRVQRRLRRLRAKRAALARISQTQTSQSRARCARSRAHGPWRLGAEKKSTPCDFRNSHVYTCHTRRGHTRLMNFCFYNLFPIISNLSSEECASAYGLCLQTSAYADMSHMLGHTSARQHTACVCWLQRMLTYLICWDTRCMTQRNRPMLR